MKELMGVRLTRRFSCNGYAYLDNYEVILRNPDRHSFPPYESIFFTEQSLSSSTASEPQPCRTIGELHWIPKRPMLVEFRDNQIISQDMFTIVEACEEGGVDFFPIFFKRTKRLTAFPKPIVIKGKLLDTRTNPPIVIEPW